MSVTRKSWVHTPTTTSENCGAPLELSSPHLAGRSLWLAMSWVVSAGRMVNDSQEPATDTIMATVMKAPPQPGAMESNT